jgi:nicotinate-nucleotide adenylyltransferase
VNGGAAPSAARLGVLGGTFDPIHLAHLWMAEQARSSLALDRVLLIPAGRPPHKPSRPISDYAHRLAMTRLAVVGAPGLVASTLESDTSAPSFTIETLRRVRQTEPDAELWLIIGSDSLRELPTWRDPDSILAAAALAVLPRPGEEGIPPVPPGARLCWLSGPRFQLSSTELRERVAEGASIRFLVPEAVRAYIEEHHLYRGTSEGVR